MNDAAGFDIELITQLKSRYCRHLDAKEWTAWRELFADDFVSEIAGRRARATVGADEFVSYARRTLGKRWQTTVHCVRAGEISLTSSTTARGVWALRAAVAMPARRLSNSN